MSCRFYRPAFEGIVSNRAWTCRENYIAEQLRKAGYLPIDKNYWYQCPSTFLPGIVTYCLVYFSLPT